MSEHTLPRLAASGDRSNGLERVSDGGGEFPDGYRLTRYGTAEVGRWFIDHFDADPEECGACAVSDDQCPVHYGVSAGIDLVARKLVVLGDDPELFARIPDPAPGGGE